MTPTNTTRLTNCMVHACSFMAYACSLKAWSTGLELQFTYYSYLELKQT